MQTHIVAKTLVFNDDGKLLKIRRSLKDDHRPGGADIPGGQVDDGEEIVAGAVREIFEEVGLTINPNDLHLAFSLTKVGYNATVKGDVNIVWLGFVARLPIDRDVRLSHEHEDYEWLTIDEALVNNDSTTMTKFLQHLQGNGIFKEFWAPEA